MYRKFITWIYNNNPELRKIYYDKLIEYVISKDNEIREGFLCDFHNKSTRYFFTCPNWINLKEVKLLDTSNFILEKFRGNLSCGSPMFNYNTDRILFLKKCLNQLKK